MGRVHDTTRLSTRVATMIHLVVVIMLSLVAMLAALTGFTDAEMAKLYAGLLTIECSWLVVSWWLVRGSVFSPYGFFLLAGIMFNAGHALLETLGLSELGQLNGLFSDWTVARANALVGIGLASFHLGALVSVGPLGTGEPRKSTRAEDVSSVRLVGWILLALAVVPAATAIRDAVVVAVNSGYMALYQVQAQTGVDASSHVMATFLIPGALFLLAGSAGRRPPQFVAITLMVVYALATLVLGFRLNAVMPLIALIWVYHRAIRRLPITPVLVVGSIAFTLLTQIVRVVRGLTGAERFAFGAAATALRTVRNPFISVVSEMGFSQVTVAYTLELVPHLRGFDHGLSYLYGLLTFAPNLFWDVHPSVARGTSASWLIWTVSPVTAAQGGGLGFSFIAEAYMNFGWIGSVIALGVIGILMGLMERHFSNSNDVARIAAAASFTAFFLRFARGESVSVLRPLVWYALLPLVAVYLIRAHQSRRVGARRRHLPHPPHKAVVK